MAEKNARQIGLVMTSYIEYAGLQLLGFCCLNRSRYNKLKNDDTGLCKRFQHIL